jgi:membrane peptidoglycan carboxypeptidase
MKEIDIEEMIANSRKLIVSLVQPNGEEETYCYLVDTPGFCTKIIGESEELVDFDFIPEWVTEAVIAIIK